MSEDFLLNIIAVLNEQATKKKIKDGLKGMDNSMYVKVISKLSIALSQRQLKKDLKQLNDLYLQVGADLKIDSALKKKLQGRIKTLQDSISDLQIGVSAKDSDIAKTVTEARNKGQRVANRTSIDFNIEVKKEKAIADLEYMAKKYSKLFSNASASSKYNNILDAAYGITDDKQLSNVRAQIAAFTSELKANNLASQSLSDKWKSLIDRAKDLFSAATFIKIAFTQARQAISTTLDLDKVYTDLIKVNSELKRNDYADYLSRINQKAKELATTQKGLIEGATEFSKSGFDLATSDKLSQKSTILANVGDMSDADAAKAIISGVQAYDIVDGYDDVIDKAGALIDKYNEIGNTASITTAEIAQGVQKVGSVFADANTSVDQFIALLSAGNRQFQDADNLSLGLRTAALRIRGCSAELEAMGEETDNVYTSTAKLAEKIEGLTNINGTGGVKILEDDEETFRSIYDIFLDISKVYKEMSDTDQSALLELIAGKNRASAISATLNNMSEAEEILQNSINAAGSAQKEYDAYLQSTEAHLAKFQATLVETYSTFMNGDMISHAADLGTAILDLVNSTDLLRHGFLAVLSLNIGKGITSIGASIASATKQFNMLGSALQQVKNLPVDSTRIDVLEQLGNATKSLTEKNLKLLLSKKQLDETDRIAILSAHNLTDEEAKLKLEKMGLLSVTKSQTTANVEEAATTGTLKNAMLSLKASVSEVGVTIKGMFASNPIGMGLMLISTIISVATTAISKANEKLEETRRANIDAATTASENANKLKDLYNEYTRLASIQDRTTSEEESFKTAVENITVALGDKAKVLEGLVAGTDEYAEALKEATKAELENQYVSAKIGAKAAEDALKNAAYSSWDGSQITIQQNEQMTGVEEHMAALEAVKDILSEYEDISQNGIEWEPVNWDSNHDDMNAVVEYYNALIEARNKLVTADNADFLMSSDIYEDINTTINDLSESVETYTEQQYNALKLNYEWQNGIPSTKAEFEAMENSILSASGAGKAFQAILKGYLTEDFSDLAVNIEKNASDASDVVREIAEQVENVKNTTFEDAWADSFTSEDDKVRELGDTLLELAEQGRLTIETFNNADSTGYFKNLGISADEAVAKINKLVDESSQLSSMSSQISAMAEALGTKQENGFVEADTLASFDVEVRGLESWDEFQKTLGSTTSSYGECQEAANALATEWVNSSDFLAQLTEDMRGEYETQLKAMGIENYEEVISHAQALNEAKEVLAESSLMLGNATYDEIEALIAEGTYSELTANMILALYDAKIAEQAATIDTTADCANLIALAGDTDRTSKSIQLLIELMNIYSAVESGVYGTNTQNRAMALEKANQIKKELEAIANGENEKLEIEPTVKLGSRGKSSAKSAGKDVGKEIKDGIKDELSDLEGIISSLSKAIDDQKEVITSQKEVALEAIESQIEALEAERDARLAVIEAEKAQLEAQIKAIDKQIDAKQKEIDAINDAAKARQHEIDLQKAQYELERMQNQRVILQYSEDKGMHYVADESGIRDAKESVDDAKRQLDIDAIEREIDLLEESKDLLNEKIDLLDEQADNINKFYDSQIKSLEKQKENTEKYFESLMKSIEGSKDKYQELLDIVDKAELSGKLKKLGIDEEALLNGSEEEFEKLKNAYLDVVFKVNEGNEEMLSSLRELSGYDGTAPVMLTDTTEKLDEVNEQLDSSTQSMDKLSTSATTASEGTSAIATNMGELGTSTEGISDNITSINDALNGLSETDKLDDLATKFTNLGEAIKSVADVLGIGEEGAVSTLVTALNEISTLSLDGSGGGEGDESSGGGIISQFNNLKTAVDNVTNAISGGGSSGGQEGDASNSSSPSMSSGAGGDGESGLLGAIGEIKTATDESLGGGGGEGEDSEGGEGSGAIPQFKELKTAVDEVTAAIGTADSEGGEGTGEESENTLIGALRSQYETASETLPETKVLFEELLESIMSCVGALNTMVGLIGSMSGIGGGLGGSGINITPHAEGTVGNAFANGTGKYKGLANREKNALVSEYGQPEMTVLPNGKTIFTDKPTMMDLPKDTVIFNEEQTKKIMDNKVDFSGNAYANGTGNNSVPYQPTGKDLVLMQLCHSLVDDMIKANQGIVKSVSYENHKLVEDMTKNLTGDVSNNIRNVSNITTNNNNVQQPVNNTFNITMPNVTNSTTAEELMNDLQSISRKKYQIDW